MTPDNRQMKRHKKYFPSQDHFTACMAQNSLLKTYVEREVIISEFAPGFFEGKPRGKQTNKKHLKMN
jgi:hypothetical protein